MQMSDSVSNSDLLLLKQAQSREEELHKKINELQGLLAKATEVTADCLAAVGNNNNTTGVALNVQIPTGIPFSSSQSPSSVIVAKPGSKRGYLFKWQDRSIGWGGTKWALRFVSLDGGRISYFASHNSMKPYYTASLGGCAVRDDGFKRNRKHHTYVASGNANPPLEETGAYFHVFSLYQIGSNNNNFGADADEDEAVVDEIVPLLRFSSPSLAEKNQWVQLISESCAYCETDQFIEDESKRVFELEKQRQQQQIMSMAMPEARPGTLPPLFFAPPTTKAAGGGGGRDVSSSSHRQTLAKKRNTSSGEVKKPPKLYRSKSQNANLDSTADQDNRYTRGYPPSKPMHRVAAASYLSDEAPVQNYRGLFNLAVIIMVLSNLRLIMLTIRNHGFALLHVNQYWAGLQKRMKTHTYLEIDYLLFGLAILNVFVIIAYIIESMLCGGKGGRKKNDAILSEKMGMLLHQMNAHSSLLVISYMVWYMIESPILNVILLMHGIVAWMKILSYIHANQDHRLHATFDASHHKATLSLIENLTQMDIEITYPQNVTLGNMYYYMFAPTLTYQIAYPKVNRVRILKLIGILLRIIVVITLMTFLVVQIVSPTLKDLIQELDNTNGMYTVPILTRYWLKLSITNCYLWLLMFYGYFHLYLNLWAELLRFGDRVFYKDWWNSLDVSSYWRLWNLPVHYWVIRHIYFPCLRKKVNRTVATFIVFLFSAILHEVLVSLPCHMIRPWSFLGMMMQLPLIVITKILVRKFPGSSIGNIIFWLSFCIIGQPMAIMLYTIDYQLFHNSNIITTMMKTNSLAPLYNNNITTTSLTMDEL